MGESSTGLTPKRKNKDAGGPSPKKRKKKKKQEVFSRETEDILSKYEDAIEECRETISEISPKVERISCTKNESKKFLETLRNNISLLAEQKLTDKIYIGVFGRTGVGKSSLINAIVNERHILPSGGSQACTSVIVNVQANTESNKYRADIEFISREDWNEELQFLLGILSSNLDNRPDEDAAYDEDADEMQEMAKEKIKAVYGEDGLHKDYNELVADKKISEILKNFKTTSTFDTLSQSIGSYIRSDGDGGLQYWPLVKCVTISLPRSPALLDRIVLVDLPGTGDANKQRDEMWKECLSRCASVWIVSDINRALSDKEAQKIFDESLRTTAGAGECHNITFVCTKTDDIDPKEIRK
ncbi:nuclear GTPase SLIP-GC-like [Arapaima gigas]